MTESILCGQLVGRCLFRCMCCIYWQEWKLESILSSVHICKCVGVSTAHTATRLRLSCAERNARIIHKPHSNQATSTFQHKTSGQNRPNQSSLILKTCTKSRLARELLKKRAKASHYINLITPLAVLTWQVSLAV